MFRLLYHPDVKEIDLPLLDSKAKERIKKAIEERLAIAPEQYGKPLRKNLSGYWKLKVGDYRVVFKVIKNDVLILGVVHRRDIYEKVKKRSDSKE